MTPTPVTTPGRTRARLQRFEHQRQKEQKTDLLSSTGGREKHWLCDLVEKRCFHPGRGRGGGGCPDSDRTIARILNVSSILEGNLMLLSSPSPSSTHRKKTGHIFSPQICRMAVAMSTGIRMLLDIRFFRSSVAMVTKYHLPD